MIIKNLATGEYRTHSELGFVQTCCGCWYSEILGGWVMRPHHLESDHRKDLSKNERERTWIIQPRGTKLIAVNSKELGAKAELVK